MSEYKLIRKHGETIKLRDIQLESGQVTMPLDTFLTLVNHANELQEKVDSITDLIAEEVPKQVEKPKPAPTQPLVFPWGAAFIPQD